jgi:pimeloyl-ACP methyl ester carboxylesterase
LAELTHGEVVANGVRFAYLEAGAGPLALCLHGFPDSPWTYRHLLPALAGRGYRAVAPFLRGYAPTEVSADGRYGLVVLADDAIALHEALGGDERAVIVGHDWGAAATYGAAARAPGRWRRVVIANIPPFAVYGRIAFRYDQIRRSFYFWFFQMAPAEAVVAADDMAFLDRLWADWSPGYDAGEDLAHAKDCLRAPANLRAALGYYRAVFDPARFGTAEDAAEQEAAWGRPLPQPTLYLHGANDGCMTLDREAMASVPAAFGPGSEAVWVEGAGHFLLLERPAEVNERILGFLASP